MIRVVDPHAQPIPAHLGAVPIAFIAKLLGHRRLHGGRLAPEVVGILVHHRPVPVGQCHHVAQPVPLVPVAVGGAVAGPQQFERHPVLGVDVRVGVTGGAADCHRLGQLLAPVGELLVQGRLQCPGGRH